MSPPPTRAPGRSGARGAADAARQAGARAAVEMATVGGARLARAADRAGPLLDRLDESLLPAAGDALEVVAEGAAAASRALTGRLLRLAVRVRLLSVDDGVDGGPSTDGEGDGAAAPVGRAVLERGARIAVLGLVAMIVLSTAAALLPWVSDGQPVAKPATVPTPPEPVSTPPGVTPTIPIGPYPGDSVSTYVAIATNELADLAHAAPDTDLLALVDLSEYRSPQALHALLSDYRVTQVFFAVPGVGPVHQATIRDPLADVVAAFDARASDATRRAAAVADPAAQQRDRAEASALRAGCACAFAAVVRAPAVRLVALRADPAVRIVDAAPPGTLENAVRFVPVAPDQT